VAAAAAAAALPAPGGGGRGIVFVVLGDRRATRLAFEPRCFTTSIADAGAFSSVRDRKRKGNSERTRAELLICLIEEIEAPEGCSLCESELTGEYRCLFL